MVNCAGGCELVYINEGRMNENQKLFSQNESIQIYTSKQEYTTN